MKLEQPASQGRPVLANPPDNDRDERADVNAPGATPPRGDPAQPDAYSALTQELLRLLGKLADGEPKPSRGKALLSGLKSFFAHPLIIVLATFGLSVVLGGYLTNKYTLRQQELASRRSFTDELNKIRVQKIGEVWEHIDRTEVDLDALLVRADEPRASSDKELEDIVKLVEEDVAIVNKNRFWLGDHNYDVLKNYLGINRRYILDKLLGQPGVELTEAFKNTARERGQAKQDIIQIRNMFLKGELEP